MANDVKLQEGHPVDENLRPLKVGGKATAIETAQHGNGVRVNGDLEVTGDISSANFTTGDITGVDLTGGTGIEIASETGTTSGDYSSTINCNLEGTELISTGETGGSKFLREDGDGTCSWQTASGGGGGGAKSFMDWHYYQANLSVQNRFYAEKHNDEYAIVYQIDDELTSSGYSTTSVTDLWRVTRYGRRIPYTGTITRFASNVENVTTAANTVEVALWWMDAEADDTEHENDSGGTIDHICTLTFEFSNYQTMMSKKTTSFNATAITEDDWFFITARKTTSGDGSYFHIQPTINFDIS